MKANEARRNSAAIETPDQAGALEAVGALMSERRRYEGWISALNARRAATPAHVFERVHLDYTNRLNVVIDQLTSHADALRRAMDALAARLTDLGAEQQRAEDERAEAELRAHVGELSSEDWDRTAATSDAAIAQLATRRSEAELELSRIRELLESTARPVAPVPNTAPPSVEPVPPARASIQLGRVSQAIATETGGEPPPSPRASAGARVVAPAADTPADDTIPQELPAAVIAAEQQLLDIEERTPAPASTTAPEPVAPPSAAAPVTSAPTAAPAPRKSNGFDELAFLSSVVDTPAGTYDAGPTDMPDEKARRDTFAMRSQEDSITNLGARATPLDLASIEREDAPPATSGGRPTSAISRDTSGEGVKSLKCGECGALNYPTEWYCERCGAELASL